MEKPVQIESLGERPPFQLLEIRKVVVLKLHLEDIDRVKFPLGSQIDAFFDAL